MGGKGILKMKTNWEIRQIDGVLYDGSWIWNDSYVVGNFQASDDPVSTLLDVLSDRGLKFDRDEIEIVDDDCVIEICSHDGRPMFAAVEV